MVTLDAPPPAYDESPPQFDLTLTADPSGKDILVTVKPPSVPAAADDKPAKDEKEEKEQLKAKRAPVDFVLTIDVSSSMKAVAPVPGDDECPGFSVLDVVKHSANTIITAMKSADRIAIVSFASTARVVLPLTHTDEAGKSRALQEVESLRPSGSTNLWDGLKQSMNILTGSPPASNPGSPGSSIASLAAASGAIAAGFANVFMGTPLPRSQDGNSNHRLSSIFLLTDGRPNVEPPRGHIAMLKLYLESQPKEKTKFTINTFGFGYSLDSKLLNDIAKVGNGHFGFIPDSGMVGTTFIHAVANTYATYAEGLYVDIEVGDGQIAKDMEVLGSFEVNRASWGVQVPLGQLQYGQTRNIVLRLPDSLSKSPVTVTARCRPWDSDEEVKTTRVISDAHLPPSESVIDPGLLYHSFRLDFVSTVHKEIASTGSNALRAYVHSSPVLPNAVTAFKDLESRIHAAFPGERPADPSASSDALDLAEDISGQVLLGIADDEAFNKWGLHYLLSLSRSHQRQQCSNFKDPGLQPYGRESALFITTRDEIDTVFDNLPPPKPSHNALTHSYGTSMSSLAPSTPPPPSAMRGRSMRGAPRGGGGSRGRGGSGASWTVGQLRGGVATNTNAVPLAVGSRSEGTCGALPIGAFGGGADPHSIVVNTFSAAPSAIEMASTSSASFEPPAFKMSRYRNRSAPCFAGSSIVELSNSKKIPVERLLVGSSVKTPLGSAKVTGIVRTSSANGSLDLCALGDGLLITPWHPVYVSEEGKWRFPADIASPKQMVCDAVYSLFLEENEDSDAHAVFIGGVRCVTMGHGVVDPGDVRAHPFLSNHFDVMQALRVHPDFAKGAVDAIGTVKDAETGLMCGFVWNQDVVLSLNELPEVPSVVLDVYAQQVAVGA